MKNSKQTKRALLTSALSLALCVVMLVGSTFAWFTDSVTSNKNVIQAGNLDITATYQNVDMADGTVTHTIPGFDRVPNGVVKFAAAATDINENNAIITENLWEPGAVNAKLITVNNAGTLAAKIKLSFTVADKGLQNALWFDFVKVENGAVVGNFTEREMSTLASFAKNIELSLEASESTSFILLYGMKEEAGNEYMGKSFSADVSILAKQDTVETDGFGNQYDKDAEYPIVTQADFEAALENAKPGDDVKLSKGTFKLPSASYSVPAGVSIIGEEGTKITVENKTPSTVGSAGMVIAEDNVTLSNVTITGKNLGSSDYNAYIKVTGNNVVLDNVKISCYTVASPIVIGNTGKDNVITIKNSDLDTFNGRAVYLVDGANGAVNIENSKISGVYPISVNSASSQELTLNVTGCELKGWTSYGNIKSANFTNTTFGKCLKGYEFIRPYADTTFTGCTFNKGFTVGAGASGKTYTVNNCTSNGVKLTASNIETQLLDMTSSDGENLKKCTIVVDGTSMVPGTSSGK